MKKSIFFYKILMIFWIFPLYGLSQNLSDNKSVNLQEMLSLFNNPSKEYRTAPLWVWNDQMNQTSIDRLLNDLKEQGFGGAFVHPRPGLITEYLSDEWNRLFKYSVDKGATLGMNIWIYDENSYPSGFAGGHVPALMPESYNQGQGLKMLSYQNLPDTLTNPFICLMKSGDSFIEITNRLNEFYNISGQYFIFQKTYYQKSPWYGGFSYVDLLVPGVTEKFQELTMKGYEQIAGDQFGKIVPGVFTDEPEIPSPGGVRWTPDLFSVFKNKWGYDLTTNLPSLFEEIGDWKKVRHNYIETLLQLFIDRWAKPWYYYCEKNNLQWTGHYWEHGWPSLSQGGDNMAMYAWHQMPGIDMLFNQFNESSPRAQFGNVRSVKELRSVANQMGYKRTLCETYGGGGWEVSFEDLKRLGDWTYVLGVNFMNQHLSHSTLKGARKYDYPPVFTYHSPWWPNYRVLNDYFGRLSVALTLGEQFNDVVVIEPTTTLWNYYSYVKGNQNLELIGKEFQDFVTNLEKAQIEFDLGSENIIKDQGSVKNGKFIIGKRTYSTVVIPPFVENIEKHTFNLLLQFANQGGKIISLSIPDRISGEINSNVIDFFKGVNSSLTLYDHPSDVLEDQNVKNKYLRFDNMNGGNLFHHRRSYLDGQLVFLVNSSLEEYSEGEISIKGESLLQLDVFKGGIESYPYTKVDGNISLSYNLPPAGSLLLYITDRETEIPVFAKHTSDEKVLDPLGSMDISRVRDNAFKVDFVDLHTADSVYADTYFSKASDIIFSKYGFHGNPWNHSVQYKSQIVDRDTFSSGGFFVRYKFDLIGDIVDNDIKLCVERPEIFKIKVNGFNIQLIPNQWFLDKDFPVYDISKFIRNGSNIVELSVSPMSVFAEIEPIYLLGNFSTVPSNKGWSISLDKSELKLGSWKNQGLPFYSWEVSYSNSYKISDMTKAYKISLTEWQGTVSEVWVNRKLAGIIGFKPYDLDISDYIISGENLIELRVVGSLKNLLGPHFNNPAPGLAGPGHWKNVTTEIPGLDYQLLDYGLFENFKLISYEK